MSSIDWLNFCLSSRACFEVGAGELQRLKQEFMCNAPFELVYAYKYRRLMRRGRGDRIREMSTRWARKRYSVVGMSLRTYIPNQMLIGHSKARGSKDGMIVLIDRPALLRCFVQGIDIENSSACAQHVYVIMFKKPLGGRARELYLELDRVDGSYTRPPGEPWQEVHFLILGDHEEREKLTESDYCGRVWSA